MSDLGIGSHLGKLSALNFASVLSNWETWRPSTKIERFVAHMLIDEPKGSLCKKEAMALFTPDWHLTPRVMAEVQDRCIADREGD